MQQKAARPNSRRPLEGQPPNVPHVVLSRPLSIRADDGIQVSKTLDTCQDTVENLDTRSKASRSRKKNLPCLQSVPAFRVKRAFGRRFACLLVCKEARRSENPERLLHRSGVKRRLISPKARLTGVLAPTMVVWPLQSTV